MEILVRPNVQIVDSKNFCFYFLSGYSTGLILGCV